MVGSLGVGVRRGPGASVASGGARVPGVVAMATDRTANIYEGAAGKRSLGQDPDMTTDTVFAIFSTTKAITGAACLQLVEDGRRDLDAPAGSTRPGRQGPGPGGLRRRRQAEAAGTPARRHHPQAAPAHGRLRLRLLDEQHDGLAKERASPASSPRRRQRSGPAPV